MTASTTRVLSKKVTLPDTRNPIIRNQTSQNFKVSQYLKELPDDAPKYARKMRTGISGRNIFSLLMELPSDDKPSPITRVKYSDIMTHAVEDHDGASVAAPSQKSRSFLKYLKDLP